MGNFKNELKSMFTEHWKYLAVAAACKVRLFDKIYEGQNTLEMLSDSNMWNKLTLMQLLNFLNHEGYIHFDNKLTFYLTEKGDLLRESNSDGLFYACLNWADEHLNAWQNIHYSIITGKSSFELLYQKPFFEFLNDDSEKLRNYHLAMSQYAIDDYRELPETIDFSIHKSVMDVGGGLGIAIQLIKTKYPDTDCLLFDLEEVLKGVKSEFVKKVPGNFFIKIPDIAEAIILSRVIHDWDDDKAAVIISNCHIALPQGGILYVIENCSDHIEVDLSLLSLNMAALCQSYERSSSAYIQICINAGFTYHSHKKLNQLQTVLIFQK
ncbi:MAG: hypothetical protein IPH20_13705 [Bacteroidales bacterium]|nr:hypothetical protein [Bacteroidales bacterium]